VAPKFLNAIFGGKQNSSFIDLKTRGGTIIGIISLFLSISEFLFF
jgi:hypothetical protein